MNNMIHTEIVDDYNNIREYKLKMCIIYIIFIKKFCATLKLGSPSLISFSN